MKTLLLAVTAAAAFTLADSTRANDSLLSPKTKEQRDSQRVVSGTTRDLIDRSINSVSPKYAELQRSSRTAPSTGSNIDLAHAKRPTLQPKDARYETAWRANALKEFQIAPLK